MLDHRRTALTALAIGLLVALPVPRAVALGSHPWATDVPAEEPPEIVAPEPHGGRPTGVAGRLAGWVIDTDDNGSLPFMIVDKRGARIFAFDASGLFLGSAPVLVGLAPGDDSAPGIGGLKLSQISPDERTTPAGRFVASFGDSDHGTMLWVDLPDSISLHPVMSVNPGEHRLRRIEATDPNQHRISYGCINVPKTFYDGVVLTALAGGDAVVYVLPDTKPIEDFFPVFAAAAGGGGDEGEPPAEPASTFALLADIPDPASDPPRLGHHQANPRQVRVSASRQPHHLALARRPVMHRTLVRIPGRRALRGSHVRRV